MPPEDEVAAKREQLARMRRLKDAQVQQDGDLWTVEDMLKDCLDMMKQGDRNIVKGVFVYMYETPGPQGKPVYKVGFGQAGMGHAEEIGFLALAQQVAVESWRN